MGGQNCAASERRPFRIRRPAISGVGDYAPSDCAHNEALCAVLSDWTEHFRKPAPYPLEQEGRCEALPSVGGWQRRYRLERGLCIHERKPC